MERKRAGARGGAEVLRDVEERRELNVKARRKVE
jgi:hypothetical protein